MKMSVGQRATAGGKWGASLLGGVSQLGVNVELVWARLTFVLSKLFLVGASGHPYTGTQTLPHPPAPSRAEMMVQGDQNRTACVIYWPQFFNWFVSWRHLTQVWSIATKGYKHDLPNSFLLREITNNCGLTGLWWKPSHSTQ